MPKPARMYRKRVRMMTTKTAQPNQANQELRKSRVAARNSGLSQQFLLGRLSNCGGSALMIGGTAKVRIVAITNVPINSAKNAGFDCQALASPCVSKCEATTSGRR